MDKARTIIRVISGKITEVETQCDQPQTAYEIDAFHVFKVKDIRKLVVSIISFSGLVANSSLNFYLISSSWRLETNPMMQTYYDAGPRFPGWWPVVSGLSCPLTFGPSHVFLYQTIC